ncbi:hypothetical protein [Streptomyces cavernicola]|uniref:Uncharacterized protein n=1 Tax=Streptomyces cavernicola TaxID=3043613 RepID=A0ABT6SMC6_9ACTN|nr:hypothetical protein [Streptomyces sp. B-S-A6]MDI3408371.1 hypothetical protein [Streptomyces sp. B-S-A6]
MALSLRQQGQDWLLSCTANPSQTQQRWAQDELALVTSGPRWRVAEAPLLVSVHAMQRIPSDGLGPVLAGIEGEHDRAWWLLPPDLDDELDEVPHLTVRPAGWRLACPPVLGAANGRVWLERPDGTGRFTAPTALREALHSDRGAQVSWEAFG